VIPEPGVLLINGTQASGKTATARALGARVPRGVHVQADTLQSMIVSGGVWPGDDGITAEAAEQLALRARNACMLADSFAQSGFFAVVDDIMVGSRLHDFLDAVRFRPRWMVTLLPPLEVVLARERTRGSRPDPWTPRLDESLRHALPPGLVLDNGDMTAGEAAAAILQRLAEALV
jgi:chloramphenicol 3-O-phosphotransferase